MPVASSMKREYLPDVPTDPSKVLPRLLAGLTWIEERRRPEFTGASCFAVAW